MKHFLKPIVAAVCLSSLTLQPCLAADIEVTTTADSGAGSLREAITNAAAGDRIVFNIPGGGTIALTSDLPTITDDISFTNANVVAVVINVAGASAISITGGTVDLGELQVIGATPAVVLSSSTTLIGDGDLLSTDLEASGTIAPGTSSDAGSIGTLDIAGSFDATDSTIELDIQGGAPASHDLIQATDNVTIANSTLRPNFMGSDYAVSDVFTVITSDASVSGAFANSTDAFALPNNPFLEAFIRTNPLNVQLEVRDNGLTFASLVDGCNQTAAAQELDRLLGDGSGDQVTAITALRSGSTSVVSGAVNQLSGTIYPSIADGEINQIQNNLHSIRDRVLLQHSDMIEPGFQTPWVRGFGMSMEADPDRCSTLGYRQSVGGVELGTGWLWGNGVGVHGFAQFANSDTSIRGVNQTADSNSYRIGGTVQYAGDVVYVLGTGGAGYQDHAVERSMDSFASGSIASSDFDGTDQFGYLEAGLANVFGDSLWLNFVSLQGIRVDLDSTSETGASNFNLNVNGIEDESVRSMVGFSYAKTGGTSLGPATTQVRVGWLHEFLDDNRQAETIVLGATTPGLLAVESTSTDRDWLSLGGQLDWGFLLGGQFTLAYQGNVNTRSAFQTGLAGVRWSW
ncbi:Autotransporter beta-domain protein [Rubripirellula amarantea]|uniref:Autotransporter beta-domain protein n=1 Tax=Rubripirellula amarantea TaxID=2527999 RepID=A0A5C5WZ57_9BACT|nr:autotransporter outer membrane beta-barrel domain-containing protein [Rubripirellula amarantea]TWT55192.1 Autotransporter beta-domain protein [Rubripirellula amarantea]